MKIEKKLLLTSGVLFGLTLSVFMNQSFVVRAWDVVSNLAMGFKAVPADGTQGFNKNNLVALADDGKLPAEVLPASATDSSSSSNGGNMVCQTTMVQKNQISNASISCPKGWAPIKMYSYGRSHPTGVFTNNWGSVSPSRRDGQSNRYVLTQCCVRN